MTIRIYKSKRFGIIANFRIIDNTLTLKHMAHFDKNSDEYISNGHYRYENQEWMSIWTYKRNNVTTTTENTNTINGSESTQLIADGVPCHTCTPEIGSFKEVFIFPVDVLGQFYNYHSS